MVEGHVTVVPVDRVPSGLPGLQQGASSGQPAGDQGKEAGNDRSKPGVLGNKGDWSSRDQSPCTARYDKHELSGHQCGVVAGYVARGADATRVLTE